VTIRFSCPKCRKILKAPERGAGRQVSCPRCGQRMTVPGQPTAAPAPPAPAGKTPDWLADAQRLGQPESAPAPAAVYNAECPGCKRKIPLSQAQLSLIVECVVCGRRFTPAPPVRRPVAVPPSLVPQSSAKLPRFDNSPSVEHDRVLAGDYSEPQQSEIPPWLEQLLQFGRKGHGGRVSCSLLGVALGCVVGNFAAHYFAFFGGFALMGEPFSPARYSLVPGHMLLCGILLGLAGFGIGWTIDKRR
jgi:DNA-directed RNA polymerase subunit RPC12/RpoP